MIVSRSRICPKCKKRTARRHEWFWVVREYECKNCNLSFLGIHPGFIRIAFWQVSLSESTDGNPRINR